MDEIIRTDRVSKNFGKVRAVREVSLSVRAGEIYGFLGLNGAGKTTTIRMLLGMIRPTFGTAWIKGVEVNAGAVGLWKHVGSLVEMPSFYPDLTVRENLEIERRLRLVDKASSVEHAMERLGLTRYSDRKAKNLSLGNAQRLGLAKALVHDPEILILDEPANGLDPAGIAEIRELLIGLARDHGITVFVSSHILTEVAKLATRIGIIHEGRLVTEADADRLDSLLRRRLLVAARDNAAAREALAKGGFAVTDAGQDLLEVRDEGALRDPGAVATLLVEAGCPPVLLRVEEEELESFFLRTVGGNGGAAAGNGEDVRGNGGAE